MRSLAVSVLMLAACATQVSRPPERIAGCWIERSAVSLGVSTMRWFPDPNHPEVLIGDYLSYPVVGPPQPRIYTLTRGEPWRFCHVGRTGGDQCWDVAQGDSGSLEGGRAFIDLHNERLRIAILDGRIERVIFQGARDGCD